jgi:hypothetical protein
LEIIFGHHILRINLKHRITKSLHLTSNFTCDKPCSHPYKITGSHPVSCTMGKGSFPGVERPGRGADHPPPPSAEVENE